MPTEAMTWCSACNIQNIGLPFGHRQNSIIELPFVFSLPSFCCSSVCWAAATKCFVLHRAQLAHSLVSRTVNSHPICARGPKVLLNSNGVNVKTRPFEHRCNDHTAKVIAGWHTKYIYISNSRRLDFAKLKKCSNISLASTIVLCVWSSASATALDQFNDRKVTSRSTRVNNIPCVWTEEHMQ